MPGDRFKTILAVRAYRMLYFELHGIEECYRDVWEFIDSGLRALARASPTVLTCLHSKAYTVEANEDPRHIDIHVVGLDNELLFLGTATTREVAIADWWSQITTIANLTGSPPDSLAWHGAGTIRRDNCGSIIPIDTSEMDDQKIEQAAQYALERFSSPLSPVTIQWVDNETALRTYRSLYKKAKHDAVHQSNAEKRAIYKRGYGVVDE